MHLWHLTLPLLQFSVNWSAVMEDLPTSLVPSLPLLPDMTLDDVRDYERQMHEKTNIKVVNCHEQQEHSTTNPSLDDIEIHDKASVCVFFIVSSVHCPSSVSYLNHCCLWMNFSQLHITFQIHPLILSYIESNDAHMNCWTCEEYIRWYMLKFPKGLDRYLGNLKRHKWTLETCW